jgi:4-hydroxy-tetrahydrodipicolinate synthase
LYQLADQEPFVSKPELKGVIAASITPITADLQIDVARLAAHAARLLGEGCSYVSTFGTTGEGASFSTVEKMAALAGLKAAGLDMGRQVPGVMTPTLDDAARMLRAVADLGCRAALVLPPFYYEAGEAGIAAFYDALIARAPTDIDIILYNIPQLSRIRFTPELITTILDRHGPRIAGIKDSTGDVGNGVMLTRTFPQLAVFTGDDRVMPSLLANGGAGLIGGLPNLFACDLKALYDDPQNAALLDKQAARIAAVDAYGSLVALKAALAHYTGDEAFARTMPPLLPLDAGDRARLVAGFEETGFHALAA